MGKEELCACEVSSLLTFGSNSIFSTTMILRLEASKVTPGHRRGEYTCVRLRPPTVGVRVGEGPTNTYPDLRRPPTGIVTGWHRHETPSPRRSDEKFTKRICDKRRVGVFPVGEVRFTGVGRQLSDVTYNSVDESSSNRQGPSDPTPVNALCRDTPSEVKARTLFRTLKT